MTDTLPARTQLAAVAPLAEARRDRWGRYLVLPPTGGKPLGYTRATTVAKTLDSGDGLIPWKATMTMVGALRRKGLLAAWQALAAEHPDPWYASDAAKKRCKDLVEECATAGGAGDRADLGTALHALTLTADLGGTVNVTPDLAADLDVYRRTLAAHGLDQTSALREQMLVLDTYQVAGTTDYLGITLPGFRKPLVCDLKTGADLHFGWGAIEVQLAIYAHAEATYTQGAAADGSEDVRGPAPDVDQEVGIVIHLPAGTGECHLYAVDLVSGWEAFQRSMWVRDYRAAQRRNKPRKLTPTVAASVADEQATEAATPTAPMADGPVSYSHGDVVLYMGAEYAVGVDNGESVHLPDLPDHLSARDSHPRAGQFGGPPAFSRWVLKRHVSLVRRAAASAAADVADITPGLVEIQAGLLAQAQLLTAAERIFVLGEVTARQLPSLKGPTLAVGDLDRWQALLDEVEARRPAPYTPPLVAEPDPVPTLVARYDQAEGGEVAPKDLAALQARYLALGEAQAWVNAVVLGARNAGHELSMGAATGRPTVRRFEALRGLVALAEAADSGCAEDDIVRALVAAILDTDAARHPANSAGQCVGVLGHAEAARFALACTALAAGDLPASYATGELTFDLTELP